MVDTGFPVPLAAMLSDNTPPSESVPGAPGTSGKASRDTHQHPRLTSSTIATLGTNGEVQVNFTRMFAAMPVVICQLIEAADNQPVIFKVKSWMQDGNGNYTGATIKGSRLNTLPASIALLTNLISFNIAAGVAMGAQFACLAIQPSS